MTARTPPAPATTEAWAIKAPAGRLARSYVRETRKATISDFCETVKNWRWFYRRGYRCVKVQITEKQQRFEQAIRKIQCQSEIARNCGLHERYGGMQEAIALLQAGDQHEA